jgi:hypothetical protein
MSLSVTVPWRRHRADGVPARVARFTYVFLRVNAELRADGMLRKSNLHSPLHFTQLIFRLSERRLEFGRGQLGGRSLGGRAVVGGG